MRPTLRFYMDDSGVRQPNRKASVFLPGQPDYFALGGVLINENELTAAEGMVSEFARNWDINYPLHSSEIRKKTDKFRWLHDDPSEEARFLGQLERLLLRMPVTGIACVIDRPGYDHRYRARYRRQRWHLCKTAFSIAVERAAKRARDAGCKLRVFAERCSRDADNRLRTYYDDMRKDGCPFDATTSGEYRPLAADELRETLIEFRTKEKSSPLIQIADLYLYPMVRGRYFPDYRPYRQLRAGGKLIDDQLDEGRVTELGIKYSCFHLVDGRP